MLREGHYKVDFDAALPGLGGRVTLKNGIVKGGDGPYAYSGTYSEEGAQLIVLICLFATHPGAVSVFGTQGGAFELALTGSASADGFVLRGKSPVGGREIHISGCHLDTVKLGQI